MSLFDLSGQWSLVTGANRGIGKAIALGLAGAGSNIVLCARDAASLVGAAYDIEALGVETVVKRCDLHHDGIVEQLFEELDKETGGLDILVNNAARIRRSATEELCNQDWEDVIGLNLTATFKACREAARRMLKKGAGKIINVSSVLGFSGGLRVSAYSASKGGVTQLTRSMANEWGGRKINVNAIAPGYVKTDLTRELYDNPCANERIRQRISCGRWGTPDDMQGVAIFLASSASNYVNGETIVVDGGWLVG